MPRARASLVAAVAALGCAPAAHAATVNLSPGHGCAGDEQDAGCHRWLTLRLRARPGEVNRVVVDRTASGFVVRQRSARLAAGRGCRLVRRGLAECAVRLTPGLELSAEVLGGDMGDRLDVGRVQGKVDEIALDGGAGDDVLLGADRTPKPSSPDGIGGIRLDGGAGRDVLRGGRARESLDGGAGADVLRGGRGDDILTGDAVEGDAALPVFADRLDGGPGEDTADYGLRRRPVTVDLADPGADGEHGEGDVLVGIEDVWGGDGPNVLRGDGGPNVLQGGGRVGVTDRLEGRRGDDVLDGFGGANELVGGPGDDRLRGVTQTPDCGRGTDAIDLEAIELPAFGSDCERVVLWDDLGVELPIPRVDAAGTQVAVRVAPYARPPFSGRLLLTTPAGTVLARRQVWMVARGAGPVTLPFTAAGRRLLEHRPAVRARLSFRDARVADDGVLPQGVTVVLRR